MTHHQGMSLVALDNVLYDGRMEKRFHADPLVRATELLLQERIPQGVPAAHPRAEEVLTGRVAQSLPGMVTRVYDTAGSGHAAHAAALKWHLQRHDHDCRSGIFRVRPKRRDSLARRRHPR